MSFYRWCMRYGAAILFVIAALQLVLGIILVLQSYSSLPDGESGLAGNEGASPLRILMVLQQLIGVFTTAALPFFGALLIYRLDRRADPREAEPFE